MVRWPLAIITCLALGSAAAGAQELLDLSEVWTAEISNTRPRPGCGETFATAEMWIREKLDEGVYLATIKSHYSYELCDDVNDYYSAATVRINGNTVTMEYDNPDWWTDTLVIDNGEMEGVDTNGIRTRWHRARPEPPQTDAQRIEAAVSYAAHNTYAKSGPQFREAMKQVGLSSPDAEKLTWEYYDRLARCIVDAFLEQARGQSIPLRDALGTVDPRQGGPNNGRVMNAIDFEALSVRENECAVTVGQELGLNTQLGTPGD